MEWIKNTDCAAWENRIGVLCENVGKWVIYIIINKINGKVYIGKSYNFRKRMQDYKGYQKNIRSWPIARAIKKYGIGNFDLKIIEDFHDYDNQKLKKRETFWIRYYNSINSKIGYNATDSDHDEPQFSEERKKQMSEARKGKKGLTWNKKPVCQIDIESKQIIKIFDCALSAAKSMNITRASLILRVCNKTLNNGRIYKTAHGFGWCFIGENIENKDFKADRSNYTSKKSVNQIDIITGGVIAQFSCAEEAALHITGKLGSAPSISKLCNWQLGKLGERSSAHGFYWEYVDNPFEKRKELQKHSIFLKKFPRSKRQYTSRKIKQIDSKTGQVIKIWEGAIPAAFGLGKNRNAYSDIQKVCNKYRDKEGRLKKSAYGYYWEWND